MRNLKKVFAVILTVALLASLMVPALAAVSHEAEALKLQKIGLMAGGPADLKLDEGVTRIQGLAFAIRAAGKEAEALAMTDEEVAAELAKFVDSSEIPGWGRKYAAYAIKHGITVGVGNNKFAALDPISGTSFLVFLLKSGMGYSSVTTANVIEVAVDAGVLTAGQAVTIGSKAALIRDDAAVILYGAAMNGVNADGKSFIQSLIDAGFVSKEVAIEAGFVEEEAPEAFEVVSVTADNLIQAVVKFNQPVDAETAGDADNYSFATADKIKIKEAAVSEDKLSVTLTFEAKVEQQKKAKLTINGVKSANGEVVKKTTEEVYFLDNTIPEIVSVEVIGISTIKVTFSEPMDPAKVTKNDFKVNNGKFYVQSVTGQKNNTEFLVKLYTSLKTGELPFEVKVGPADYAGFTAMGLITTLDVVEDDEAPVVVGYKDAKPNSVVLIWSEDIEPNGSYDAEDYYHTNKNNKVSSQPEIEGNEMKLVFDNDHKLPNGTAYVYVLKDAVKDYWNNKNAQQMVKIEVTVDETAPTVTDVKVDSEKQITLTFDEELDADSAKDKGNYTLLDAEGKEVSKPFRLSNPIAISSNLKKVTLYFKDNLEGDYTLVIDGVKDTSGNEMDKVAVEFTVDDLTPPDFNKVTAVLYKYVQGGKVVEQYIIVNFFDNMATEGQYSVLDASKYVIKSYRLEEVEDAVITLEANGKSVKIEIPHRDMFAATADVTEGKDYINLDAGNSIVIARVADEAGNYTPQLVSTDVKNITLASASTIDIEKVELTGAKEVKVYFADDLAKFNADDLQFATGTTTNDVLAIEKVSTELKDGKTVATYTLNKEFKYDASNLYVSVVDDESENVYGEKLTPGTTLTPGNAKIHDKLAAALKKDANDKDDVTATGLNITLNFTEALDAGTITVLTFSVDGFKVTGVNVTNGPTGGVIVLTVVEDASTPTATEVPSGTAIVQQAAFRGADQNTVTGIETKVK
ncbi:MAG: Ig-like domain-containing protein [Clostridiaceae bacterium]|nr:Ig-like domain-containing protein [Clostridiaceae bacterium]